MFLCSEDGAIVELPIKPPTPPTPQMQFPAYVHIWGGVQWHSKPVVGLFGIG